jgi:hypothetical protein
LLAPHPDDKFKVARVNELMVSFADRFCSNSMQDNFRHISEKHNIPVQLGVIEYALREFASMFNATPDKGRLSHSLEIIHYFYRFGLMLGSTRLDIAKMYRIDIPIFDDEDALPIQLHRLKYAFFQLYSDPRGGISLRYGNPDGTVADVYLYDGGFEKLPDGVRFGEMDRLFESECHQIIAVKAGLCSDFRPTKSQELKLLGGSEPSHLCMTFTYSSPDARGVMTSHMAIRADMGFLNKVRYTYPSAFGESGLVGFEAFLRDWGHAIDALRGKR